MRAQTSILGQKVSDEQAKRLRPIVTRVYSHTNVDVLIKSQLNLEMIRDYKADIELGRYTHRTSATIDRDEMIMLLSLAMGLDKDIAVPVYGIGVKVSLRRVNSQLMITLEDEELFQAIVNPLELETALKAEV